MLKQISVKLVGVRPTFGQFSATATSARILRSCMLIFALFLGSVCLLNAQNVSLVRDVPVSPDRAERIALDLAGGGMVMEIELERKQQQFVYEVEIRNNGSKHEVKIDGANGEVIRYKSSVMKKQPTPSQISGNSLLQAAARTSFARAEETALAFVGGGTVLEIELERKIQQVVYEVEIRNNSGRKQKVKIDAQTGEVISRPPAQNGNNAAAPRANNAAPALQANVFPTSVTDVLNISRTWGTIDVLEIVDANGRAAVTQRNFAPETINVSSLTPGIYILKLTKGADVVTYRFTKN